MTTIKQELWMSVKIKLWPAFSDAPHGGTLQVVVYQTRYLDPLIGGSISS
jgi:hypothetical protein